MVWTLYWEARNYCRKLFRTACHTAHSTKCLDVPRNAHRARLTNVFCHQRLGLCTSTTTPVQRSPEGPWNKNFSASWACTEMTQNPLNSIKDLFANCMTEGETKNKTPWSFAVTSIFFQPPSLHISTVLYYYKWCGDFTTMNTLCAVAWCQYLFPSLFSGFLCWIPLHWWSVALPDLSWHCMFYEHIQVILFRL